MRSPDDQASGPASSPPRALFLRPDPANMPDYIARHFTEQAKCLSLFFDLTVAPPCGDYGELCETHQPELVIFESGVYATAPRDITNVNACPHIPKLGFLNADANCPTRSVFLSDMERWGVETFFTHSVAMAEYTPQIADRLFVWPNAVDPEVYTDYGLPKLAPVLSIGSRASHYPWRNRVLDDLAQSFPTLSVPHLGWFDRSRASRMVHGRPYAELINACAIAPTCGTFVKEVVRKHFEIPACKTCLLTEPSAGLIAAGFADMDNCVFAEEGEAREKVEYLLAHPDELRRISQNGHAFVHARHTWRQRDQIQQWFLLKRSLRPDERIIQTGPFGALGAVARDDPRPQGHVASGGRDRALIREAASHLAAGRIREAERLYDRCVALHPATPEPHYGAAICALEKGDPARAHQLASRLLTTFQAYHAADPDPVEWTLLLTTLLCLGRPAEALERARRFEALNHPELDRMRQALGRITGGAVQRGSAARAVRASVHMLADCSEEAWLADLERRLRRCGQGQLADQLPARSALPGGAADRAPLATAEAAAPAQAAPESLIRTLFCCDPDYYQHLAVALVSLLDSNRDHFIEIHLITETRSEDHEQALLSSLQNFTNFSLLIHEFSWSEKKSWHTSGHITAETYTRILSPHVLDAAIDKILYLDADLVVVDDLAPLWNTNIDSVALAAVADPFGIFRRDALGMPGWATYVNAGVLLINLKRWREDDIPRRLADYIRRQGRALEFHDQDAINAVLFADTMLLDARWNLQARAVQLARRRQGRWAELRRAAQSPGVIHYASRRKPWMFTAAMPKKGLYWRYLKRTAWRGASPSGRRLSAYPERLLNALLLAIGSEADWQEIAESPRMRVFRWWRRRLSEELRKVAPGPAARRMRAIK